MRATKHTASVDERTLDALAARLAPLVAVRLAAMLTGASSAEPFTTREGGPMPPEFAGRRRTWVRMAPSVPGAVKVQRWWSVPRDAYASWLASHATTTIAPAAKPANDEKPWDPLTAGESVGLRASGDAR